jgi:hypothetical protein
MAKSNPSNNNRRTGHRSAAIREMLAQHPHSTSTEIVSLLKEKGIKVNPHLVYYVKGRLRKEKRVQKRQHVLETSRQIGNADPVALILKVRGLAHDAGGIRKLKQLIDALAE